MKSLEMPEWINRWVRKQICSRCRRRYQPANLLMFGISLSEVMGGQCFIKMKCPACHQILTVVSMGPDTMREVVARTQRDFERKDQRKLLRPVRQGRPPKMRSTKPKLTRKDADDLKKLLDQSQTHDDFLRSIGMSQEEIDRLKADPEADKDDGGQK